jgi:hypothetical protein
MSVLSCCRSDCTNIMCDRCSPDYGYICETCFNELVRLGIGTDVEAFMDSPIPNARRNDAETALFHFEEIFPIREGQI